MTKTLICTVGGSHQPVVAAIVETRPDYVVFICTGKDLATGRPGSNVQITGKGNCIKAHQEDDKPTLPNIPAQAGLASEQFQIGYTLPDATEQCTSADDLDQIVADCSRIIDECKIKRPSDSIIVDYTGGTKSMSAGLIIAALEYPDIDIQLVTGSRSDLIKVQDGSHYAASATIEQIRFRRSLAPYLAAWTRYAYSEAEAGLKQMPAPKQARLRGEYGKFRDLSRAFAAWDNFNHKVAAEILKDYAPSLPPDYQHYLNTIMRLNDNNPGKRDAARLFDLYRNAERRASQGRHDDAIARVYRLIEWTAQWLLKTQCGIDTADIPETHMSSDVELSPNRDGKYQAGLYAAWQLVKHKTQGAAAEFIKAEEKNLLNHLKIRNASILAHGFEPINAENWQTVQCWLEAHFIPMLLSETTRVGIRETPRQLPDCYSGQD